MKNLLVQYRGGGYDGCHWEWNYFAFDKDGAFHCIAASGYKGLKTEQAAIEYLKDYGDNSADYDVYQYQLPGEWSDFVKGSNSVHVAGVIKYINDNLDSFSPLKPYFICSYCGNRAEYEHEGQLVDWHGCGGVASTADGLVCIDCLDTNTCTNCNEYSEDTENGLCSYCAKENEKDRIHVIEERYSDIEEICFNRITNELFLDSFYAEDRDYSRIYVVSIFTNEGEQNFIVDSEAAVCAIEDAKSICKAEYIYRCEAELIDCESI